jgi:hypothetical protein
MVCNERKKGKQGHMNSGENFKKISHEEINEAMRQFLKRGGKIKKIETVHNSINSIDPLADDDRGSWDEIGNLNFNSGISSSTSNW